MIQRIIKISFLTVIAFPCARASAWSVGIGGIVSIGNDGVKAGPGAHGVDVPMPFNCGGTICDTVEKAKNDITGEADRKKAQQEYEEAAAQFQRVQGELNSINQEIDSMIKSSQEEREKFKAYKASQLASTHRFNQHYETYRREFEVMEKKIGEAQASIKQTRLQANTVSKNAAHAASQLKPIFEVIDAISPEEQVIASLAVAGVVKNDSSTEVANAISSLQKIAIELNSTFKKSYDSLVKMSNPSFTDSYSRALDQISQSLEQIAKNGAEISASTANSKIQNDQIAATIGKAQE